VTATIHLVRSSGKVWAGFMHITHEDKTALYLAENKKVGAVMLALCNELVKHDLATTAIIDPGDLLPPLPGGMPQ